MMFKYGKGRRAINEAFFESGRELGRRYDYRTSWFQTVVTPGVPIGNGSMRLKDYNRAAKVLAAK